MAVASDSLGTLKLHCNNAILYFIKHQQCHTVFYETSQVASRNDDNLWSANPVCSASQKHCRMRYKPTVQPSLNHLDCFYVFISVRAPYGGGIFKFRHDKGFIG